MAVLKFSLCIYVYIPLRNLFRFWKFNKRGESQDLELLKYAQNS